MRRHVRGRDAAIIGTVLGRSATRPIGDLVLAAERIQEGRYDTAVVATGGAEFRSLAATFNSMQKNIAERDGEKICCVLQRHSPLCVADETKGQNPFL